MNKFEIVLSSEHPFVLDLIRIMNVKEIHDDIDLTNLDSLTRTELVAAFEETMGIGITDAEVRGLKTFGGLRSLVESKVKYE